MKFCLKASGENPCEIPRYRSSADLPYKLNIVLLRAIIFEGLPSTENSFSNTHNIFEESINPKILFKLKRNYDKINSAWNFFGSTSECRPTLKVPVIQQTLINKQFLARYFQYLRMNSPHFV
jgi:hypothetical protein